MPLSCECDSDYDSGDWEYWFFHPRDYTTLKEGEKSCRSCRAEIVGGDLCTEFSRYRYPETQEEEEEYGDEVPIESWYHCERCADLYFSLDELGFCVQPEESMLELVKDYAEMVKNGELGEY